MKRVFSVGDLKTYKHIVEERDIASFNGAIVHPFYSTYSLTRDAEWSSRLFVLDMIDNDEEGIGTFININHVSPALIGMEVVFTASIKSISGNEIIATLKVMVGNRLIATGETGQKIVKKEKLDSMIKKLNA